MHCSYYNWLIVDGLSIILDFFAKYNQLCEEEKRPSNCSNTSKKSILLLTFKLNWVFGNIFHWLNWKILFNNIINCIFPNNIQLLERIYFRMISLIYLNILWILKRERLWIPKLWQNKIQNFGKNMLNNNVINKGGDEFPIHYSHNLHTNITNFLGHDLTII